MAELSVILPSRNEEWLARTVEDVLAHSERDTECIVLCDGAWSAAIPTNPRVQVLYVPTSIGQRAATNIGVKLSTAKYCMKLDGHCAVSQGFDRVLIEAAERLGPRVIQIPKQRHLKVYDQVCKACKHRGDQAPWWNYKCPKCGSNNVERDVVWHTRKSPTTTAWRLNSELEFGYDGEMQRRETGDGKISDTMTSLGACCFMERKYYEELGGFDEGIGSWGFYGAELALKAWLSGGRHVTNRECHFAHLFRVGGLGFPYAITGDQQQKAKEKGRNIWLKEKWKGQKYSLLSLVERFWPVNGWTDADLDALRKNGSKFPPRTVWDRVIEPAPAAAVGAIEGAAFDLKNSSVIERAAKRFNAGIVGAVYYSDCLPDQVIIEACRRTIERAGLPIVAVTLKSIDWPAATNIVLDLERSYLSMFKQILAGLEALDTEFAHLVEHDLLYHPSHLSFVPPKSDRYFYNAHVYKVDADSGRALHYRCNQTSGLTANRELLIEHYRKRVEAVERDGFTRRNGFEPGTRKIRHGGFDDVPYETWMSVCPNIDIRHGACLTQSRWKKEEFRDQRYTAGWTESDSVPGWGVTAGRFRELLDDRHSELQIELPA